MLGLNFHTWLS